MVSIPLRTVLLGIGLLVFPAGGSLAFAAAPVAAQPAASVQALAGMPPVTDPLNAYSATGAGQFSPATAGALSRVYVPEHGGDTVSVIDPATLKVVDHFAAGLAPQHIVPSWDLKTLWVTNNNDFHRHGSGSLTPIDPLTGKPGPNIAVTDPYNMYFMPDGSAAIIVNEANRRLEFRDPVHMKILSTIDTPGCPGINHADFSMDGTYALFSCEFASSVAKIDLVQRKLVGVLKLHKPQPGRVTGDGLHNHDAAMRDEHGRERRARRHGRNPGAMVMSQGMPQDVRLAPDGKVFYVADMLADGVYVVDGSDLRQVSFIPTGPGAHGFCVSRDSKRLYVSNRGSHAMPSGSPHGPGSVSVIDFATRQVVATWPIPGGGSPDMGSVSADGKILWFAGRFDNDVYAIDTTSGMVTKIKVGSEPHGLTVWPQPGRYSLGHTGNLR